jgi:cell division protein FtsB
MRIFKVIRNKYLITVVVLVSWLLFFDKNDLFSQYDRHQQVKKLEQEASYFRNEIDQNKNELNELQSNPKLLEKFAREHYLMKKDSEDIFVIVRDTLK